MKNQMMKMLGGFAVALCVLSAGAATQYGTGAQFRFTGTGNSAYTDLSGNGATLTTFSSASIADVSAPSKTGSSYALNITSAGGTATGSLPSADWAPSLSNSGDGWTIACWIKPDGTSYKPYKGSTDWQHVIVSYDPGHIRAIHNQTLVASGKELVYCLNYGDYADANRIEETAEANYASKMKLPLSASGSALTLGGKIITGISKYTGVSSTNFKGYMAEPTIINRSLSCREMTRLYHTGETYIYSMVSYDEWFSFNNMSNNGSYNCFWSSWIQPKSGIDFIVDSGHRLRSNGSNVTFAGRSLTLGRLSPLVSRVTGATLVSKLDCWLELGTTGYVEFPDAGLILNAGKITGLRGLRGNVTVNSPVADPFTNQLAAAATWTAAFHGATGTGMLITGGNALTFGEGALTDYQGAIIKSSGSLAFASDAAFSAYDGDGIILRTANLTLPDGASYTTTAPITAESGTCNLAVSSGSATLSAPLAGTFTKSGTGTLTLATTGSGRVNLPASAGSLVVANAAAAANVGNIAGGTVTIGSSATTTVAATLSGNITANTTIALDLNNGNNDSVSLTGTITSGKKVALALSGTVPNAVADYTLATVPEGTSYQVTGVPAVTGGCVAAIYTETAAGVTTVKLGIGMPPLSSLSISSASATYNGSVQKPTLTVLDSDNNALTENSDYTVN